MSEVLNLALADDIVSRLMKAVFVWQLGHKGIPSRMKLPNAEYNELMVESVKRDANPHNGSCEITDGAPKYFFRDIEVVRNNRNFIEFDA